MKILNKIVSFILALLLSFTFLINTTQAISKPDKPVITSLVSSDVCQMKIKTNVNSKVKGYQIQYSTNKDFTSKKVISVKGTKLNYTIKNLTGNKTYYVRVRSYKVSLNKRIYSNYSIKKYVKIKAPFSAYTIKPTTLLHTKASGNSSYITLWYNTKLTIYDTVFSNSNGNYKKVKYNGKTYYVYSTSNTTFYTTKKNNYEYVNSNNTKFQNEIISKALSYMNVDTRYNYHENTEESCSKIEGKQDANGVYPFCCAGFVHSVFTSVMQEYCPAYTLPYTALDFYNLTTIYNNGYDSAFNASIVCKGSIDYSKLEPGDIIFFKGEDTSVAVNHVGIYLGGKEFIQSTKINSIDNDDGGVCIAPLTNNYEKQFVAAYRILPKEVVSLDIEKKVTSSMYTYLYPNASCNSSEAIERIPYDTIVTLKYTCKKGNNLNGYVEYTDGDIIKKGFVYKIDQRLLDIK